MGNTILAELMQINVKFRLDLLGKLVQTWLARLLSKFASGQTRATKPQPERRGFQRWPVRGAIAFRYLTKRDTVGTAYIADISQGGLRLATISTVDEGDAVSCETGRAANG
jgi:hypothetical protein